MDKLKNMEADEPNYMKKIKEEMRSNHFEEAELCFNTRVNKMSLVTNNKIIMIAAAADDVCIYKCIKMR